MFIDFENKCAIDMNSQEILVGDKVATTVRFYAELQICTVAKFTKSFVWVKSSKGDKPVRKAINQVVKVV